MPIRFCPHCAAEDFVPVDEKRWECSACGFSYYHNVAAASVAVMRVGEEILLTQRAHEPQRGFFDLPGGFVEADESAELGLIREVKEELGLGLCIQQLRYLFSYPNIYPFEGIVYRSSDSYFEIVFDEKPVVRAADDVQALRWERMEAINFDRIAFEPLKAALKRYAQITSAAANRRVL